MVNWKSSDSTDRLVASLVAAHPSLRIDYHATALVYGQGATYDAIESRFRRYRAMADDLRAEAQTRGVNVNQVGSMPRTPRGPRSRPTPSSSKGKSTGKTKKGAADDIVSDDVVAGGVPETPTKKPKLDTTSPGLSALTAIALDESESEVFAGKHEDEVKCEVDVPVTPAKSRLARSGSPGGTPTPVLHRIKREDLGVGSVLPVKRSIESSPGQQRKAAGVVPNMGVAMSVEVDTDEDGDVA